MQSCKGTPIAKKLQKNILNFCTNQGSYKDADKQVVAMKKTINYFKEFAIKYNEKSDEDLEEIVKRNIKNQLLNKVLNIGTR